MTRTSAQAFLYLQASVIGTLCNFFSRFAFSEWFSFGVSVVLANYVGMIIVFCLSYKRAFGVSKATVPMVLRFALVAHVGLVVVWAVSTGLFSLIQWLAGRARCPHAFALPQLLSQTEALRTLEALFPGWSGAPSLAGWIPVLTGGGCHGTGILAGFLVNFFGHKLFSFAHYEPASS